MPPKESITSKVAIIVITVVVTFLATMAGNGLSAVSRAEVEEMIRVETRQHEEKIDTILMKLEGLSLANARMEEKLTAMREERIDARRN